eukprot:scaffold24267_cov90-Isochrysis_galbana.AAC.3
MKATWVPSAPRSHRASESLGSLYASNANPASSTAVSTSKQCGGALESDTAARGREARRAGATPGRSSAAATSAETGPVVADRSTSKLVLIEMVNPPSGPSGSLCSAAKPVASSSPRQALAGGACRGSGQCRMGGVIVGLGSGFRWWGLTGGSLKLETCRPARDGGPRESQNRNNSE